MSFAEEFVGKDIYKEKKIERLFRYWFQGMLSKTEFNKLVEKVNRGL